MRFIVPVLAILLIATLRPAVAVEVKVIAEEDVYTLQPPNNGAGPLWCSGCTVIVRDGDQVFASQMETGEGVPRLCNTRWRLLQRKETGWTCLAEAEGYRQREPCPLAVLPGKGLYLYVNDSIMPPGTEYGPCEPHLLHFAFPATEGMTGNPLKPVWDKEHYFTDHSYRGYGADAATAQLLMMNVDAKTSVQNWALLDADGNTINNGGVTFPIRACYQQLAMKDGTGHVLAIGDIVEPNKEWRTYKYEQSGQKWDYVFRRLFYAASPDLASEDFGEPIEIANVDATAGHIFNQDLWIAPDGCAYILYTEREVQSAVMRNKFFPDKSIQNDLKLAVVQHGKVSRQITLIRANDDQQAGVARFQETPDGKLYAVCSISGKDGGNVLLQVYPSIPGERIPIPLKKSFGSFNLATVRAGNAPSATIDIFGHTDSGTVLSYAQAVIE